MSMLQAARAEALGLSHDSALSWGLNRAIFFAAAKRGFKGGGRARGAKEPEEKGKKGKEEEAEDEGTFHLGDEMAYTHKDGNKLYFTIGGDTQTPQDFKRQIQSRFQSDSAFEKAWNEATKIVKGYDEETLKSARRFYEEIYKPRRDSLASKWNEMLAK
jgi:hypothetical protein